MKMQEVHIFISSNEKTPVTKKFFSYKKVREILLCEDVNKGKGVFFPFRWYCHGENFKIVILLQRLHQPPRKQELAIRSLMKKISTYLFFLRFFFLFDGSCLCFWDGRGWLRSFEFLSGLQ